MEEMDVHPASRQLTHFCESVRHTVPSEVWCKLLTDPFSVTVCSCLNSATNWTRTLQLDYRHYQHDRFTPVSIRFHPSSVIVSRAALHHETSLSFSHLSMSLPSTQCALYHTSSKLSPLSCFIYLLYSSLAFLFPRLATIFPSRISKSSKPSFLPFPSDLAPECSLFSLSRFLLSCIALPSQRLNVLLSHPLPSHPRPLALCDPPPPFFLCNHA